MHGNEGTAGESPTAADGFDDARIAALRAASEGEGTAAAAEEVIIDLRDGAVADPTTEHGHHHKGPSGRPDSLAPGQQLVAITGGDLWMEAEAFVYGVYVKIGYTRPNSRKQVEELARWADDSRFHAVVNDDGSIVGTIRTIYGPYDDLPIGQFDRTDSTDPDPVCELSSLVVDPAQRSTGVIEHLYRAGWLDAWRSESNVAVALIDDWLLEVFQQTYHLPFRRIGVEREYMGTVPIPVALPLDGASYRSLARSNPDFWAWTLEAVADDEVDGWGLPQPTTTVDRSA